MIRKLVKLGAVLSLSTLTGCFFLRPWDGGDLREPPVVNQPAPEGNTSDVLISDAWLEGQMQTVGDFDTDAYEVQYTGNGDEWGNYASITLHGAGVDGTGWAMIRLETYLDGGFEGDAFAPGAQLTSATGDIDATGCSGPSHGNWDFDGQGEVTVTVEEGPTPGSRVIHYEAFYRNGQVTRGSFQIGGEPVRVELSAELFEPQLEEEQPLLHHVGEL